MRLPATLLLLVAGFLPLTRLYAGLINVNFTSGSPTAPAFDGTGIYGGGIWNRIQADTNTGQDSQDTIALKDSAGDTLAVTLTAKESGIVFGDTRLNGNAIQSQSWIGNALGAVIFVDIAGLIPGQIYQVAVYSNRVGSGDATDPFSIGGEQIDLPNPGEQVTTLPGVEGEDYVLFTPTASSTGKIRIVAEAIAGLQIRGRLQTSEKAPALDAMITSNPAATTGLGQGARGTVPGSSQTLTQKGALKRPVKFYPILKNAGSFIDRQTVLLTPGSRDLDVVLIDRQTGGNATAAAKTGTYGFVLEGGQSRGFQMQLKALKARKSLLAATFAGRASTGDTTLGDVVAGALKLKAKR